MYNTDGTCDGVIVKIVSDFFRIEYDSKYNQKMEKLIETDTLNAGDIGALSKLTYTQIKTS